MVLNVAAQRELKTEWVLSRIALLADNGDYVPSARNWASNCRTEARAAQQRLVPQFVGHSACFGTCRGSPSCERQRTELRATSMTSYMSGGNTAVNRCVKCDNGQKKKLCEPPTGYYSYFGGKLPGNLAAFVDTTRPVLTSMSG
jgi:hypothetical protein